MVMAFALIEIKGIFDNNVMPNTGKVDLAVFLKNSLRDWSSSFCFLFDINYVFTTRRN